MQVPPTTRFPRLAHWGLTLAAILMGVTLLATVWSTNRGVRSASEILVRGQANLLADRMRTRLEHRRPEDLPTGEELDALVDDLAAEGLRWTAVLDEDGRIRVQGGRPAADASPAVLMSQKPTEPVEVGGRIRLVFRKPDPPPGAKPPVRDEAKPPHLRPRVFEFEPTHARELRRAASQTLGLGGVAGIGFLVIAVGLVRWFLRHTRQEQQRAQERHLATLGHMSAVMAHEIRNPLASLKGNAQLLARSLPEGERARSRAELLVHEALRLEALTSDLLDFARMGELQLAEVDPGETARSAAEGIDPGRVELVTEEAPARWPLDGARMHQVLANLVENAVQAGDGLVTLRVARVGSVLVFEVRDHGEGIKDEDLPRLFEPFFTRRTQGTGLGLAICKRLVELHGGTIEAANAVGGGARFTVRIPRRGG